jgi:hypothetical protein
MRNNELKEYELMNKIMEARRNNLDFIEFNHGGTNIKIRIKKIYTEGIMRGNIGYFSK